MPSPADIAEENFADGIQTVTSLVFKTAFPFSSLVLSAGFRSPADGWLLLEVQVCVKDKWSGFYKLGLLSGKMKSSFPAQQDHFARVETDELVLSVPAEAYRFRLKLFGGAEITLLAATAVGASFSYDEKSASRLPAGAFVHGIEGHPDLNREPPAPKAGALPLEPCPECVYCTNFMLKTLTLFIWNGAECGPGKGLRASENPALQMFHFS